MKVTELTRYPLKSGHGQMMTEIDVEPRGLAGDRTWMVVDPSGHFVTARTHPALLSIHAVETGAGVIVLTAPLQGTIEIRADQTRVLDVTIWSQVVRAVVAEESGNQWISQFLGFECFVVYLPKTFKRPLADVEAVARAEVSFADGYPLLLTSQSSLADLNGRLDSPVTMDRFRPNLVVDEPIPFAEDDWKRISIGQVEFLCFSPCARCVLITIDPDTHRKSQNQEPLRTLSTYRRQDGGVMFGINLVPLSTGTVSFGDTVTVLE